MHSLLLGLDYWYGRQNRLKVTRPPLAIRRLAVQIKPTGAFWYAALAILACRRVGRANGEFFFVQSCSENDRAATTSGSGFPYLQCRRLLNGRCDRQLRGTNSWCGLGGVGSVKCRAGEKRAGNDVSERDGKEVPEKNLF